MKLIFRIQKVGVSPVNRVPIVFFRGLERKVCLKGDEVISMPATQAAYSSDYADLVKLKRVG